MEKKKMNKRQQSKQATRERIIKAAIDVFCDKGYVSASVAEIARRAGISVGAIFFHFTDKRTLYISTIEESNLRYAARLEGAVDRITESRRTTIEKIEAISESHLRIALAYTEFYSSAIHELFLVDIDFELIPKQMCQSIIAKMEKIVEKGIEENAFRQDTAVTSTTHLIFYIPIITLSQRGIRGGDQNILLERCQEAIHSLMEGMIVR
ncbi:MAG: TetR/AcrR family transcriptional regulator [Chloroflexota bacterium]|nr:TetR/AcrR family transcriptional regulator [Chloroflexota bacterium]